MEIPEIKAAIEGVPYARPTKKKPGFVEVEKTARMEGVDKLTDERDEGHRPATDQYHPEDKGKHKDKEEKKTPPGHVDITV